ncbi:MULTISPECIES: DoxX family protein [Halobacterium]|uniref:DoxX family protein n=1 Tax=Halobacterium TaxID=2239 RepID=UPI00073EDEAF|nr:MULTISPECIES: DoxX family protein [Halobacterium]MCG1002474.1 DoxX family protein [Halobacterium noricense]
MAAVDVLLLVGRVLFGGVLAFMGLNHFMQTESMTGYAQHKGLPAPKLSVLASGAVLVLGGLSVVTGIAPVVGAVALAGFLVVSALTMHDFWAVPEDQAQDEMTGFLKNVALAGGALAVAASATAGWAYSVGITLF